MYFIYLHINIHIYIYIYTKSIERAAQILPTLKDLSGRCSCTVALRTGRIVPRILSLNDALCVGMRSKCFVQGTKVGWITSLVWVKYQALSSIRQLGDLFIEPETNF